MSLTVFRAAVDLGGVTVVETRYALAIMGRWGMLLSGY